MVETDGTMARTLLAALLAQGLSVERIAAHFGRHPSTVSYWMRRYGLAAVNREKHLARGGIAREQLEELVDAGLTIAEIAVRVDRSIGTVRHWLGRHGLRTVRSGGRRSQSLTHLAKSQRLATITKSCRHHGKAEFVLEGHGRYRCKRCRTEAVVRRRRKVKEILVADAGGCCEICGYNRHVAALHFHHLDPELKRMPVSASGFGYSLATLRAEASKCVLLCSNCHAEVENGAATLPLEFRPRTA